MSNIDNFDRWWVVKPFEGFIDIQSESTGKVICTIEISDYDSLKEAQQMATFIAFLPELIKNHSYKDRTKRRKKKRS